VEVGLDAVDERQLGAGHDEVHAVGERKSDETGVVGVGDIRRFSCGGGAMVPRAHIDVVDAGRRRETPGESVFPSARAKQEDGEHGSGPLVPSFASSFRFWSFWSSRLALFGPLFAWESEDEL